MVDFNNIQIEPELDISSVYILDEHPLYFESVLRTGYYNYYFSYGRHFRPKSIFEIGVRTGYTAYAMLLGADGVTQRFRGIDLETYIPNSCAHARRLLLKMCSDVGIQLGDSHQLRDLGGLYDLIHVDGDHSRNGKILDLRLALGSLAPNGVIVVDDAHVRAPAGGRDVIYRATMEFAKQHGLRTRWFEPLCGTNANPLSGHLLLMR